MLNNNNSKMSLEHKEFLEKCIAAVEKHLNDEAFNVDVLQKEMGMSHSTLYRRVKLVSGLSINAFIRLVRLRKAADILINTDRNTTEAALMVGFNGAKYFRQQFQKEFGMLPSEYIKKHRKTFDNPYTIKKDPFETD
jgi:AraC-like DNA-binding protein